MRIKFSIRINNNTRQRMQGTRGRRRDGLQMRVMEIDVCILIVMVVSQVNTSIETHLYPLNR